jgi:alpha-glucosidase
MKQLSISILLALWSLYGFGQSYQLASPDNELEVRLQTEGTLSYSVYLKGEQIIAPSEIYLTLSGDETIGRNTKVTKALKKTVSETIRPVVPRKFEVLKDEYNELELVFKGRHSLVVRAYDEGVACRWVSARKGTYKVLNEKVAVTFTDDHAIWFPEEQQVYSHQEREYIHTKLSEIDPDRFCSTGTLVDLDGGVKVFISESDLVEYPGMFLQGSVTHTYGLEGKFAGYPLDVQERGDRDAKVMKHADYLAKVEGPRAFPWRAFIVSEEDKELLESELIYKLATPLQLEDVSWIKPGKVAWDWWNANNIFGVDFEAGVNTNTYKYFIDFASEYGLEYIILDEGWYHLKDVLAVKDEINIPELVAYGKEKNVGLILWVTWKALDEKLDEALQQFSDWGIKGIKVDFMQRDDQWMVNYYHRVAKKAAAKKLLVNYHGAYKPTGMRRAYPNVITREGLLGMEQTKWSDKANPDFDLLLPFIRMVSGPMDYTPGAMKNATKRNFRPVFTEPMSAGTRCHQLAMYVVFESPLQMLSDNPSNYYRELECMTFLSKVPSVWKDTKVLQAKVGEYVAMARQSSDDWYIGAMTNWEEREMKLNLDFLGEGVYELQIWQDGINANRHAADYKVTSQKVNKDNVLSLRLAKGGGWVAIARRIDE